jgi:hypothetical protein
LLLLSSCLLLRLLLLRMLLLLLLLVYRPLLLVLLGYTVHWLMCCVAYVAACLVWVPYLHYVSSSDGQVAAARVGCEHRHVLQ